MERRVKASLITKKISAVVAVAYFVLSMVACSRPEAIADKSAEQIEYVQEKIDVVEEGSANEIQKFDELDAGLE